MRDIIMKIYQSTESGNLEQYADIVLNVYHGKENLLLEDIVPLCKFLACDFEYMEYSQTVEIATMTYLAINNSDMKEGLCELIKGLEELYTEGIKDSKKSWINGTCEDHIERYLGMFIMSYRAEDMTLFGKLISENSSLDFKLKILEILRESIDYNKNKEGYEIKGNLLVENIVLQKEEIRSKSQ